MRRILAGLLAALIAVDAADVAAQTPASASRSSRVTLAELIGHDSIEVRAQLAGSLDWPLPVLLELQTPEGRLNFIWLDDALTDPVLRAHLEAFRSHQNPGPTPPYTRCDAHAERHGDPGDRLYGLDIAFRDGRLDSVYGLPPYKPPPPGSFPKTMAEAHAFSKRPRPNPFAARPGDLPLDDGAGFINRWTKQRIALDDVIEVNCAPQNPPPPRAPPPRRHELSASDMQGLALLPFAVTLPFKNAQRTEAMERGGALVESLHVGQPLGEPVERFAARNAGVKLHTGLEPDYAVLTIDRGSLPNNNLSNFNEAALVGVRGGVVVWLLPHRTGNLGLSQDILCLDAQGVPGRVRPGCSDYGYYTP